MLGELLSPRCRKLTAALVALSSASGCLGLPKDSSPSLAPNSIQTTTATCSYTDRITYELDVDPGSDFSMNSVVEDHLITQSSCNGIFSGTTDRQVLDSVSRSAENFVLWITGLTRNLELLEPT